MKLAIDPHILRNAFFVKSPSYLALTSQLYHLVRAAKRVRDLARESNRPHAGGTVFVSYKHADRDWVRILIRELKSERYDIWFDEERMVGGTECLTELKKQINEATIFVTVLSSYACVSDGVFREELNEALAVRTRRGGGFIIPLLHGSPSVPQELTTSNPLRLSDPTWLEDLNAAIATELVRQGAIALSAEELARPAVCLDSEPGNSQISLKYRETFRGNSAFEKWRKLVERMDGFCYVSPFIVPSLQQELQRLKDTSKDGKGCSEEGSEIFIWVALGANQGYLVSEGGVNGKCRQNHKWDECPTGAELRRQRADFVLSANTALIRVEELKDALEKRAKELRALGIASKT